MARKNKLNIHKTGGRVTATQELNSSDFVYKLGDSPAYVHSYNRYMKIGTRIATTEFHRNVTQIIGQIKQILERWMLILQGREQELYSLLNIANFEQFQSQIWPAILSGKLGNNPSSIGEGLDKAINVQNAIWDIRLAEADKKPDVMRVAQKLNEALQQFAAQIGGFDVLKTIVNTPKEIKLINDDGTVAFGRGTMLKNVAKNMGFAVEHVLGGLAQEQAIQFIDNALGNVKVSAKHVGTQVNRGASDVEYLFGKDGITFTLGATVKMRRVTRKNEAGEWVSLNAFGSGSGNAAKWDKFFVTDNRLAIVIDDDTLDLMKYILSNYWLSNMNVKITNQDQFIQDLKNLIGFEYSLFGILGQNWQNSAQTVPVIYISAGGKQVYQTRALLSMFESADSVESLTTAKGFGTWTKRHQPASSLKQDLKAAKKTSLANLAANHTGPSYINIKDSADVNAVLKAIEEQGIDTVTFAVKYSILDMNIRNIL